MLTSTCESCHETLSFEDYLAGMTVRCKQCGQGWVRVPSAARVTASVPDVAEKRPATPPDAGITDERPAARRAPLPSVPDLAEKRPEIPPDTAVTAERPAPRPASLPSAPDSAEKQAATPPDTAIPDERPAPRRAPLPYDPPTAAVCPRCGSGAFTRVKAKRAIAPIQERDCKECGQRYATIPAPMSGAVKAAFYASGVVLILGGIPQLVIWLAAMQEASPRHYSGVPFGVYCLAGLAFGMLRSSQRSSQRREEREKRLQAYQASAPPGAPPPVVMPAPPDAVSLGRLFGVLALAAPLVSSLLTVVVFGPAAVLSGIVALAQGHRKGLIGLGLGAAGLIVWGSVFFFLFQA